MGAAAVMVAIGALALRSMFSPAPGPAGGSPGASRACQPQPCANPHDFELYLTSQPPQPGDQKLLRLSARFVNNRNDTTSVNGNKNRADLLDFQLRDGRGAQSRPVFDAPGCAHWDSFEIPYPQAFGPRPICFRVAGPGPLVVVWGPDLGLLFDDVRIALPGSFSPSP